MDVQSKPMRCAVHVVGFVCPVLDDAVDTSLEDAKVDKSLDERSECGVVDCAELYPGGDDVDGLPLRFQYDVIDAALLWGEPSAYRPRAGNVRSIVLDFGSGVDEEEVAVPHLAPVLDVVEDARVLAGCDDGRVAVSRGSEPAKLAFQRGLDVVFPQARAGLADRAVESTCGNVDRPLDRLDLFGRLADAHRSNGGRGVDDAANVAIVSLSTRTTTGGEVGYQPIHSAVRSERVVDGLCLREQFWKLVFQIVDGEGVVRAQ